MVNVPAGVEATIFDIKPQSIPAIGVFQKRVGFATVEGMTISDPVYTKLSGPLILVVVGCD